jgi:hypothetical protein
VVRHSLMVEEQYEEEAVEARGGARNAQVSSKLTLPAAMLQLQCQMLQGVRHSLASCSEQLGFPCCNCVTGTRNSDGCRCMSMRARGGSWHHSTT